ncbi:uncharacterized protein CG7065 [Drosophila erecta]|uniref:Uncharacterized protein n=1 Tax=Drosophila erecta TaxID=7220 RepID=B3NUH3_DROER|nr:uncharacterized protein CG7065 [Drosophila erecta]EDV46296.1 uncharacterized protein Dere_GG18290 [Drosophila erecta]
MSFLPGEPVPPGFEEDDDVTRTAVIQKQIESYAGGPLIGTEYTVELHEPGQLRPDYFCVLCQTCADGRTVFVHWTSQAHRTKYLQTHFQKAYNELQKLKRTPNSSGDLVIATGNLVKSIEKHFGRSRNLMTATGEDFRRFRAKICSQVRDSFHFDECAGPDFSDDAQRAIRELKPDESIKISLKMNDDGTGNSNDQHDDGNIIALDAISSDDESFGGPTAPVIQMPKGLLRKKNQVAEDASGRGKNRSPPPPGGATKPQHLPTPKELSIQASIIAQERYKWEKFRCMLELQLKQLRDETETYESNPEKHPDYPDEWKQFWNRRYKQLQEEKKCDPNQYDYKPEWISYWKDRRIELFNISVNKIKKDLKEKFKLSDEDEEKTKELMERYKIRVTSPREVPATTNAVNRRKPNFRNNRPIGAAGGAPDAVIDISDDEVDSPPSRGRASYNRRSISRSLSPKRGGGGGRRPVRRSRSRSPRRSYRRGSSRSRSRSRSLRRRSRSPPYYRGRGHGPPSRERASSPGSRDFADRRSLERDRERSSEYYPRNEGYARTSRGYEHMETFRVLDSRVYPEYNMSKVRSISPAVSSNKDKEPSEAVEEGPLTVVSVLRMLSAVEEHLGSLGPKALNLLSKALAMEMMRPNAAEDLLLNDDNCVFLETTKEKLKGILIAEVLDDPQKVRVVKKLITNIAAIIFQANAKGSPDVVEAKVKANVNPAPIQLPFDRNVVAPKLASALVLKGYYDVTTGDMNNLLHLLTLLVKTDKQRRQVDKNNGLTFEEIKAKLGLRNEPSPDNLGIDLDELMKEVEHQLNKESVDVVPAAPGAGAKVQADATGGSSGMESLTDSDLQTLLQNFKFLSNEEQVHLIGHLRKLEVQEPARVERLRKYVNLAELSGDGESCSDFLSRVVNIGGATKAAAVTKSKASVMGGRTSSAVAAIASAPKAGLPSLSTQRSSLDRERDRDRDRDLSSLPINKQRRGRNTPSFMIDDDEEEDDDYNFDDLVMKACDSNGGGAGGGGGGGGGAGGPNQAGGPSVIPVESSPNALTFKPAATAKISLKDTESIIANLMGTLSKGSSSGGSPSGGNRNYMMSQQHQQHVAPNPPSLNQKPGQNLGQKQSGAGYSNAGYPGQQHQHQGRNFGQEPQPLMSGLSGGPDDNQYPNPQGYGGYHPFPGNSVQQNYGGMGPGPGPGGYGGAPINPWANNAPPQPPFNPMPQNFMGAQQQQPHYNNMFGGRH